VLGGEEEDEESKPSWGRRKRLLEGARELARPTRRKGGAMLVACLLVAGVYLCADWFHIQSAQAPPATPGGGGLSAFRVEPPQKGTQGLGPGEVSMIGAPVKAAPPVYSVHHADKEKKKPTLMEYLTT